MKAVEDEVMRVKEHKETRREYMTYAMETKRRELASFAEGEKTGEKKKETMMILAMLRKGFSVESIAECAQTSVEYIMELGKRIICYNLYKASVRVDALCRKIGVVF